MRLATGAAPSVQLLADLRSGGWRNYGNLVLGGGVGVGMHDQAAIGPDLLDDVSPTSAPLSVTNMLT